MVEKAAVEAVNFRCPVEATLGVIGALEYEAPPDTVWRYNTEAYQQPQRQASNVQRS